MLNIVYSQHYIMKRPFFYKRQELLNRDEFFILDKEEEINYMELIKTADPDVLVRQSDGTWRYKMDPERLYYKCRGPWTDHQYPPRPVGKGEFYGVPHGYKDEYDVREEVFPVVLPNLEGATLTRSTASLFGTDSHKLDFYYYTGPLLKYIVNASFLQSILSLFIKNYDPLAKYNWAYFRHYHNGRGDNYADCSCKTIITLPYHLQYNTIEGHVGDTGEYLEPYADKYKRNPFESKYDYLENRIVPWNGLEEDLSSGKLLKWRNIEPLGIESEMIDLKRDYPMETLFTDENCPFHSKMDQFIIIQNEKEFMEFFNYISSFKHWIKTDPQYDNWGVILRSFGYPKWHNFVDYHERIIQAKENRYAKTPFSHEYDFSTDHRITNNKEYMADLLEEYDTIRLKSDEGIYLSSEVVSNSHIDYIETKSKIDYLESKGDLSLGTLLHTPYILPYDWLRGEKLRLEDPKLNYQGPRMFNKRLEWFVFRPDKDDHWLPQIHSVMYRIWKRKYEWIVKVCESHKEAYEGTRFVKLFNNMPSREGIEDWYGHLPGGTLEHSIRTKLEYLRINEFIAPQTEREIEHEINKEFIKYRGYKPYPYVAYEAEDDLLARLKHVSKDLQIKVISKIKEPFFKTYYSLKLGLSKEDLDYLDLEDAISNQIDIDIWLDKGYYQDKLDEYPENLYYRVKGLIYGLYKDDSAEFVGRTKVNVEYTLDDIICHKKLYYQGIADGIPIPSVCRKEWLQNIILYRYMYFSKDTFQTVGHDPEDFKIRVNLLEDINSLSPDLDDAYLIKIIERQDFEWKCYMHYYIENPDVLHKYKLACYADDFIKMKLFSQFGDKNIFKDVDTYTLDVHTKVTEILISLGYSNTDISYPTIETVSTYLCYFSDYLIYHSFDLLMIATWIAALIIGVPN
uniref:hypothetical protein n=1 Tax=Meteora sporadica TaxID=2913902 RepID=UPI0030023590|nr:hypothetical protein [Meteora sporadica]WVH37085.1 hypothetical protein [Meteora sporadica]